MKISFSNTVKTLSIAISMVCIAASTYAQMHRPILQDVFELYNLLNRDYSGSEEPEVKQKRIEDDRTKAIAILGNYADKIEDKQELDSNYKSWEYIHHQLALPHDKSPNSLYSKGLIDDNEISKIFWKKIETSTEVSKKVLIEGYPQIQNKLMDIKKILQKELEATPEKDKNQTQYLVLISAIESIDNLIRLHLFELRFERDKGKLHSLSSKFGTAGTYENPLLKEITDRLASKYKNLTPKENFAEGKNPSEPEIASSGLKAAFGLPGIAGSAPMMVDVINEILVEEIKAELSNAVFSLLRNQLLGDVANLPIENGVAKMAFTIILESEEDSISITGHTHRFDKINPRNNVQKIAMGQNVIVYSGKRRCGKVVDSFGNSFAVLGTLFPQTKKLLEDVAKQEISQIVDMVKETIREDLKNLLPNLANLDQLSWIKKIMDKHQEVAIAFEGIRLMNGFASMRHPVEIFSLLPESDIVKRTSREAIRDTNVHSVLRLMELFTYSLTLEDNGTRAWVSANSLEPFLDKADFYRLYFGCLLGLDNKYPSYQIKWFKDDNSGKRIIPEIAKKVQGKCNDHQFNHLRTIFYQFSLAGEYVNDQLLSIKQAKAKGEKPTHERVVSISNSISSIVDTSLWVCKTILGELQEVAEFKDLETKFEKVSSKIHFLTATLRASTDIYKSLGEKQYVLAVGKSMNLLQSIFCEGTKGGTDNSLCEIFNKGDWQRTANFLVSIAIAEDRDDLEAAMRQFAHNPGSWRVKRDTRWNIALGVYGGGFFGCEYMIGDSLKIQSTKRLTDSAGTTTDIDTVISYVIADKERKKANAAFTLTVGPTFSKGFSLGGGRASLSLHVPLIDIGTVTSLRINDPDAGDLPTFQWRDIFAPGAVGYFGFPNVPISLGFGVQYSPALRKIEFSDKSNIHTTFANSFRYGACLAVDLSLLNFFTSASKRNRR